MDFHSGRVLAAHNPDERRDPASITKIMATYTVFRELAQGKLKLTDPVTISERAWRTQGSRMFVELGSQVSVEELLHGVVVQSGNDASVALAEHIAGSEEAFANLMNAYGKRIGLTNSHFTNSHGWPDPEHYMTAHDIALVARRLIADFPQYYAWHAIREYAYNGIKQYNRNALLWRDGSVDGVKTGHTEAAGYCLVSSAKRDDMRLIAVVLGSKSPSVRADESLALLNYGFRFYETHRLYEAGQTLTQVRVWMGEPENVPVGLSKDLYVTVPRGQAAKLDAAMHLPSSLEAPAARGKALGSVKVTLGEDVLSEQPLIALAGVEQAGLWRRLVDGVLMRFQ